MSDSLRQHDVLLTLLGQLCGGAIDDAGWTELEEILLADEEAREIYRQYLNLHMGLRQYHLARRQPVVSPVASPILGFLGNGIERGWDLCWRTAPFSIIVAVGFPLVCAMILGIHLFLLPTVQPGPIYVAQLIRAIDCTWVDGVQPPIIGEVLAAGRRMVLTKGSAEIAMSNGTALLLEGPATLDLNSAGRVALTAGTLSVKVPKQAVGFAVQTPDALVVDFGTEFGVVVDRATSEVRVLVGEVALRPAADAAGGAETWQHLVAGQGGRVDRASGTVAVFRVEGPADHVVHQPPAARQCRFRQGEAGYAGARDAYICGSRRGRGSAALPGLTVDEPDTTGRNFGREVELLTSLKPSVKGLLAEHCRTLIAFDGIFGDAPGQIPKGAVILSAVLRVRTRVEGDAGTDANNRLHEVLVPWDEDTVTWSSLGSGGRPGVEYASEPLVQFTPDRKGESFEMNVTESLRRWAAGEPNHGWILMADGENRAHFDSSDAASTASRPELLVEYRLEAKESEKKK